MPFLEQPHCQLSSWVWWMNSTVASSAVDSEVPQLREEIPVLTLGAYRQGRHHRGCSPCMYWGRVVWLHSFNRLASWKLYSFFSTSVKELHQVGEEIPKGKRLRRRLGFISHSTSRGGWRTPMWRAGESELHVCPQALAHMHALWAGEMPWGAVRFCLGFWTTDNLITGSADCFMAFRYFRVFVFQVLYGLWKQTKALIHTPF